MLMLDMRPFVLINAIFEEIMLFLARASKDEERAGPCSHFMGVSRIRSNSECIVNPSPHLGSWC